MNLIPRWHRFGTVIFGNKTATIGMLCLSGYKCPPLDPIPLLVHYHGLSNKLLRYMVTNLNRTGVIASAIPYDRLVQMNSDWIDSFKVVYLSALRAGSGWRHFETRENVSLKCIWLACTGRTPPSRTRGILFPSGPFGFLGDAPGMSAVFD